MNNYNASVDRLACFPRALQSLIVGITDTDLRFRPPSQAWSILEVLCHLADEEERDFRPRLERTLHDEPWEPIDPEGWAIAHRYNEQSPAEVVARFAAERERSVLWLKSLENPNWDQSHDYPNHGPITAGEVFASWVAHDALHMRQIARRMHDLAQRDAGSHGTGYAGQW